MEIKEKVKLFYDLYGQRKPMGDSAPDSKLPHFFLLRPFWGLNDLLIIFNTKRCRYQCYFCQLPAKSSKAFITSEDILLQFDYVIDELKHSLSIIDSLTLSNEGSILDSETFPIETLLMIAKCTNELRRVRKMTIETRLEFINVDVINDIKATAPRASINILTGFETLNSEIRDKTLAKRESVDSFVMGLDKVAESHSSLTSYILYKPSPAFNDEDAFEEATNTFLFLKKQCDLRGIPLSIRINPLYAAKGSKWAMLARNTPSYQPPKLTDIMRLAENIASQNIPTYIGLSTEGLKEGNLSYESREDFSPDLIKKIVLFNNRMIKSFS